MNFFPFLSALFLSASVAVTHSCHAMLGAADTVKIVGKDNIEKHIRLMKLEPERLKKLDAELFRKTAEKNYAVGISHFVNSANSVDLGMNNVPVLDQGEYGTCVTFSSTAALDTFLGSDFISQQCSLALDMQSGNNYWDGADYPSQIIDPLKSYGVVSKDQCPEQYPDNSQSITVQAYQSLADVVASSSVKEVTYSYSATANLTAVKAALKAGKRVVFATQINGDLQKAVQGFDVKVDGVQDTGGLWACKQPGDSINYCANASAGHEIVIIGYDDAQQLLKIRNSWSSQVGDNGDYYMTYTFFNAMAQDFTVIN